jgi:hypothetical protein
MKRVALGFLMVGLLGWTGTAQAGVCDSDVRPAATLLLPYFEVDTADPAGVSTVFSIGNALETAVLAHVTIWTDISVPVMDFNVYLTGFDMELIDLGSLIRSGSLPQTASDGQDPADTISPQGVFSQDINFASCNSQLPSPPTIPALFIDHLQKSLTGQPSLILGNRCAARNYNDGIARGYVTVDVVSNCTLRFASDPGYFGPGGDALDVNALFGDYSLVRRNRAATQTLVHIEADAAAAETSTAGQYTFYGRYVGWTGADHREPLPTTFGARFDDSSDLIVWRDSKVVQQPVACPAGAGNPAWWPLDQEAVVLFDLQENPLVVDTKPFKIETQRVKMGGNALPFPGAAGWAYLNLNTAVAAAGANPPEDPDAAQAWVSVLDRDGGNFLSGYDAMRYDSACQAKHSNPGGL